MLFDPARNEKELPEIGGKGLNLYRLQQLCDVPEWVALPTSGFFQCLETGNLAETIKEKLANLTEQNIGPLSEEIQNLILHTQLPDEMNQELETVFPDTFVSVRSSAADEDGSQHSFAGIHESYLFIKGAESIAEHIKKVWASGYQERALLYRRENSLQIHPVPMAVIIQRMVDAQTSGVVFTADPSAQNPHSMIISALYGLGDGLVSAGLDADHVEYNKRSGEFEPSVATKETRFIFDKEKGSGLLEELKTSFKKNRP